MTDDPRKAAAVARMMMVHPSWFKRLSTVRNRSPKDPGHSDALAAASTIVDSVLREADAMDPFRALAQPTNILEALQQAETALVAAQETMTKRQAFEAGWRITEALRNVRETIFSVTHPPPDSF